MTSTMAERGTKGAGAFLRWAGSKAQLARALTSAFPAHFDRYIEPFCGSARLFFARNPSSAVLADINEELILTLRQVQVAPELVVRQVRQWRCDRRTYELLRSKLPRELAPSTRAARFIFLNQLCFNGLYRENSSGRFNVPFATGARIRADLDDVLLLASRQLSGVQFLAQDFAKTLALADKADFIYLDPPYVSEGGRRFAEYNAVGFSDHDLDRLELGLLEAERRGALFMLSYADGRWVRALARRHGWRISHTSVRRSIAGFVRHRSSAAEVVVRNYSLRGRAR